MRAHSSLNPPSRASTDFHCSPETRAMAEESANLMQRIELLEYRLELVEKVSRPSKLVLRLGLHGTLFRGTLVLMFCHMTAIFACKNFNRAIAQSVEPSEACSGSPAGTGKAFGTQLGVAFLMM